MPNGLADETSVYLQQHRDNPVAWRPWGEEAWERARLEDKPVLVSIGYSSCHWCHVMERESFEDADVAAQMNEALICIKVDREERPDVDQIYMDAVVRLTGQGGWPLNMFCTPDGRPFYGGTYFPPGPAHGRLGWRQVVEAVTVAYREQGDQVHEQAERVMQALRERPDHPPGDRPGHPELTALVRELMRRADRERGGFGAAPKFPTPTNLEAILFAASCGASAGDALEHLLFTLKRMARGGIYDQLGGGFHRYSTDASWLVPHFEKMLYDQGQLLRVYAEAYRQTRDPELAWPVEETIAWLEREMRSAQGGFYASQDADSEGEEGTFYVWSRAEVEAVLGPERGPAFCDAYGVTGAGTFERTGRSVLEHGLAGERPRLASARADLLAARASRVAPDTDRKHVTSWIAYTAGGLASAAAAFDRADWREAAARSLDFVRERMRGPDARLLRIWDGERARVPGFLDDHAALLCALLDLQRAGGDDECMDHALEIAERIAHEFWSPEARDLFFAPPGDTTLVFRPTSDSDGATPAANGLATLGLVRLGELTGRSDLLDIARAVLDAHGPLARRVPAAAPTLLRAAALLEHGLGVAIVLGEPGDPRTQGLARRARTLLSSEDAVVVVPPGSPPAWLGPAWLEGRKPVDESPTAYLCRGKVCSLPATREDELALPPGA